MLFTICHRKFQFGHESSWNMHFSDETMGENESDGEKRTEKRVNTHTDTDHEPAGVSTTVTEKTHARGLQNVTFIKTDLELLVSRP